MYFPYLYSRQAELNAISDIADSVGSPQQIFPLIEPVTPAAKLVTALEELKLHSASAYVVANPHLGKLTATKALADWQRDFASTMSDSALVFPTLKEGPSTTALDVANFVATYPNRKIGIVLSTSKISPNDLSAALSGADYTVFFLPSVSAANYISALDAARTVDVSDNFRTEARNMDYSGEEWLANNHASWNAGGRGGFSDFTMLPGDFKEGGGPVGAVAVHLTYVNGPDLWIQHFISATNAQTASQAIKFREVLADIESQRFSTPNRFEYSPGIKSYEVQHNSGNYTNLSGNKRQQISHHIFTISKLLGI